VKRPSHATIVAYLALFVALAGTASAVSDRIGTKKIKRGAVTTSKLRAGAVTAPKLRADAVGTQKLQAGAVTGAKIGAGSVATGTLADSSVTGVKVADGSLGLEDVATRVITGSFDPPSIAANDCDLFSLPTTPGLSDGQSALLLPVQSPSNNLFVSMVLANSSSGGVFSAHICNASGTSADFLTQHYKILVFG
jgi:hypothetical protein